jgi:hypothetical protein
MMVSYAVFVEEMARSNALRLLDWIKDFNVGSS